MKIFALLFCYFIFLTGAEARIITVGSGGDFINLTEAADDAVPGDTIYILNGVYNGGLLIDNLRGEPGRRITITGPQNESSNVIFDGGTNAIHLVNPSYLNIMFLRFRGQTGNGINIDDGGDYSSPAHHIMIDNCFWLEMGANGNNDELKLSGLNDFVISNCSFFNGAAGGSMIDMVGCHRGIIENCYFINGGSNAVQAKGGCSDIIIRQSRFVNGGSRGINIGGSTGAQFFRPLDAGFESARILVHSNIFLGGQAPFSFTGTIDSKVINNTIVYPEKWVFRILQENTDEGIAVCGNNEVTNNIFYVTSSLSDYEDINIGGGTLPETFTFKNNLWYNKDETSWEPRLPAVETGGIYLSDPLFMNDESDFHLREGSPAIAGGIEVPALKNDFDGQLFNNPPSIGAFEANPLSECIPGSIDKNQEILIFPNPCTDHLNVIFNINCLENPLITFFDALGNELKGIETHKISAYSYKMLIPQHAAKGIYLLRIKAGRKLYFKKAVLK